MSGMMYCLIYGNFTGVPEMIRPAVTPAMKLFPTIEKPADVPENMMKPMDLFPDPIRKDDLSKMADSK